MKATYSKEHFKKNEKEFMDQYSNKITGFNPYKELEDKMNCLSGLNLTDEQIGKIKKVYSNEIIEKATSMLKSKIQMVKEAKENSNSFGCITKIQEVREASQIVEEFEWNCYLLKQFKESNQ
jgi:hypothetical protein